MSSEGCFLTTQVSRLKPQIRLGRQLADHFGLEPEMLWVRIPLELLSSSNSPNSISTRVDRTSPEYVSSGNALGDVIELGEFDDQSFSWSSLECSSPCHGEGRGFKSHRERFRSSIVFSCVKDYRPTTITYFCGWASAQPSLISSDGRVRHPDPLLQSSVGDSPSSIATNRRRTRNDGRETIRLLRAARPTGT